MSACFCFCMCFFSFTNLEQAVHTHDVTVTNIFYRIYFFTHSHTESMPKHVKFPSQNPQISACFAHTVQFSHHVLNQNHFEISRKVAMTSKWIF